MGSERCLYSRLRYPVEKTLRPTECGLQITCLESIRTNAMSRCNLSKLHCYRSQCVCSPSLIQPSRSSSYLPSHALADEIINISNMTIYAHDGPAFGFANGIKVVFQKDGNFVAYNSSGTAVAATASNSRGDPLALVFQDDGNLVVYTNGNPLWASDTAPKARGGRLVLQNKSPYIRILDASGNVVYTANEGGR